MFTVTSTTIYTKYKAQTLCKTRFSYQGVILDRLRIVMLLRTGVIWKNALRDEGTTALQTASLLTLFTLFTLFTHLQIDILHWSSPVQGSLISRNVSRRRRTCACSYICCVSLLHGNWPSHILGQDLIKDPLYNASPNKKSTRPLLNCKSWFEIFCLLMSK